MTKNVLIIGATGTIGSAVTKYLFDHTDYHSTLFSRQATRQYSNSQRIEVLDGNVLSSNDLVSPLKNSDFVFAALSGAVDKMAAALVQAMTTTDVKRLVMISSMGIYNEIPASIHFENLDNNPILVPFRKAADIIEESNLDYTLIRPGWFTSGPVDYELTPKGTAFGGHDVSIASIVDLVYRLTSDSQLGNRASLGINTPIH